MKYLLVSLIFISLATSVRAQDAQKPNPLKILGISVEGNKLTDAAAIIRYSGLQVDSSFTPGGDQIRQAIKQLWSLGIFSDIQILIDNKIGEGVFLLIKVKEYPRLNDIIIKGNHKIDEKDIKNLISLVKGQIVRPEDLSTLTYNLKKKYEEKGYLLAEVDTKLVPIADTVGAPVNLLVNIDEGEEVKVKSITFTGNHDFSASQLRGAMKDTHQDVWWMFWQSSKFEKKKFEDDKQNVVDFYQSHGFIDASIISDTIWYSANKKWMFIHMDLYEGKKYYIRQITWEGNTKYTDAILNDRLGLKAGEVFNEQKFDENLKGNKDQTDVASLYLDTGYLTFNLDPQVVRVPPDSVNLHIKIMERNQFRIGEVLISGNTKTEDKVIRRQLFTVPGDYFSRAMIINSVRQLSQINYFDPQKIKPDYYIVSDSTVDVTYSVKEKSSDTFNMSVGYSQAFGFTGAIGLSFNNFDITHPLEGGAGQSLTFNWQFGVSTYYRTFQLGFNEPWFMDTPTSLGVNIFDTQQAYIYDLTMQGGSLSIGRRLRWPDDYFRINWILTGQKLDITNGGGVYESGVNTEVSLTQVISRNSTDSPIFPTVGSDISLSDQIAGAPIFPGTIEFDKHIFNADLYTQVLGSSRVVLFSGTTFGITGSMTANLNVNPVDLFFMGGTGLGYISTTPLRGYGDQQVGPKRPDTQSGTPVGGRVMFKQTFELRFSVLQDPIPLYIDLFAEGGNVYTDLAHANIFQLDRAAGFGARVMINPIGLVGFDYGYGFDPVAPGAPPSGWHFNFEFGQSF